MGFDSIILGIVSADEGRFRVKELVEECVRNGIDKKVAKGTIQRLFEDGAIYEDVKLRIRSE